MYVRGLMYRNRARELAPTTTNKRVGEYEDYYDKKAKSVLE